MLFTHQSVFPDEACRHLNLRPGGIYVDGTLGGSGHARTILSHIGPTGLLIGIDQDPDAIDHAKETLLPLSASKEQVQIFHDNFSALPEILNGLDIQGVDGILVDLGLSFHQLMESQRGFSFQKDEPLDMRMDPRGTETAAEIINHYPEKALVNIFFKYGEEKFSKKIARHIVMQREMEPLKTSRELALLIQELMPAKRLHGPGKKIHPATRIFQALRIAVNKELEQLEDFMAHAPDQLNPGGRLCVISFHSLEDRIVKQAIRSREAGQGCTCPREFPQCICGFVPTLKSVFRKPVVPGQDEINNNPLSRSAKLRVAERI